MGWCLRKGCGEHMGVMEAISLCTVLLLALYGCAQAVTRVVQRLLRPTRPSLSLTVSLQKGEDAEQQIRFAKWLSKEWSIPIRIEDGALDEETRTIVRFLMDGNLS